MKNLLAIQLADIVLYALKKNRPIVGPWKSRPVPVVQHGTVNDDKQKPPHPDDIVTGHPDRIRPCLHNTLNPA